MKPEQIIKLLDSIFITPKEGLRAVFSDEQLEALTEALSLISKVKELKERVKFLQKLDEIKSKHYVKKEELEALLSQKTLSREEIE